MSSQRRRRQRSPSRGGGSIAAHGDHLRYGLELLNRWTQGEQPFAGADYSQSWKRISVSEEEWASRREALKPEAYPWRDAITAEREMTETEMAGMVASEDRRIWERPEFKIRPRDGRTARVKT